MITLLAAALAVSPLYQFRFRAPDTEPGNWQEVLVEFDRYPGVIDEVWFSTGIDVPPLDKHRARAVQQAVAAADMRKRGVIPSLQLHQTIGHGLEEKDVLNEKLDCSALKWGRWTGPQGDSSPFCSCPRDPDFLEYYATVARIYAEAYQPRIIWADDDLRPYGHNPASPWKISKCSERMGCWCPRCLEAFSRQRGSDWTRESLLAAIDADKSLALAWEQFQFESVAGVARAIGKAVREVSPATLLGLQHCLHWNDGQLAVLKAMEEASGLPVSARPGGGCYYDRNPIDTVVKSYIVGEQMSYLSKLPALATVCPEIETCPRTFTSRTAQGLLVEALCELMQGMDSLSMFVSDSLVEKPEFYANRYFAKLRDNKSFYRSLIDACRCARPAGFTVTFSEIEKDADQLTLGLPIIATYGTAYGRASDFGFVPGCQYSTSDVRALYAKAEEMAGGNLPAIPADPVNGWLLPSVRTDGTLAAVAFVNTRIDVAEPLRLKLRGVPGSVRTARWWALNEKPVELQLDRVGEIAYVMLPAVSAWSGGFLSFPTLIDRADADYLKNKWRDGSRTEASGSGKGQMARENAKGWSLAHVYPGGLSQEELIEGAKEIARREDAAGTPWVLAKARMFQWLCDNMGVECNEHDVFPAISVFKRWPRPANEAAGCRDALIDARFLPEVKKRVDAAFDQGRFSMWKDFDHSVPAWDELLAGGWPMMDARLKKYEKDTPYYRAMRITMDACLRTIRRFAAAAHATAEKASDPERRARLEREAMALDHILVAPPLTAYEALMFQFTYFFLSEHLDGLQVRSLGPLDVLLTPYYRADIAAGRTTRAEFKRDLAHFWWQWGSIDNYWGQPVALGGTKADGTSEFNEVSDLILDVHDELALPTPKMIVKISTNTPDCVLNRMLNMARRHRSITFNGEQALYRILKSWRNCTDEECRTCDLNGCYEFYVHGAQNITQSSHISFLQPIADILSRANAGGFNAKSWKEFYSEYIAELKKNTFECMELTDQWEKYLGEINPGNVYSLATDSALKNQKDAFYDGLFYNDTGLLSVGLGTTVDALLAVKELVYEKREFTLPALGRIMADDWTGYESLRLRMLRSPRKWGNNDREANGLGRDIIKNIGSWVNGRKNSRGGVWGFSGHCAKQFTVLAANTGATPDGRKAGEECSKNLSATMGADTEGVTALVDTLSNLDTEDLPVNFPLDVMLHPASVQGDRGLDVMRTVLRVYFANGGTTIQFNVISAEELRDAQRHPEKYENLQVRVCGWNVRWNDIPKVEQDKYILRAESIMR